MLVSMNYLFYPEADCCQIPPGSILPVPATIYFPQIQSPTTSEIYRIIKSKALYYGDREFYKEQKTATLIVPIDLNSFSQI